MHVRALFEERIFWVPRGRVSLAKVYTFNFFLYKLCFFSCKGMYKLASMYVFFLFYLTRARLTNYKGVGNQTIKSAKIKLETSKQKTKTKNNTAQI